MTDELRADLAWLLATVERHSSAQETLERCEALRERYGIERTGPDVLAAIRAAQAVLRGEHKR